jgi:hypothetical protein
VILGIDLIRELGLCTVDFSRSELIFYDSRLHITYIYELNPHRNQLIIDNHAGLRWKMSETAVFLGPRKVPGIAGVPKAQRKGVEDVIESRVATEEVVRIPAPARAELRTRGKTAPTGGLSNTEGPKPVSVADKPAPRSPRAKSPRPKAGAKPSAALLPAGLKKAKEYSAAGARMTKEEGAGAEDKRREALDALAALHEKYASPEMKAAARDRASSPSSPRDGLHTVAEILCAIEAAEGDADEIDSDWDSLSESLNYLRTWAPDVG